MNYFIIILSSYYTSNLLHDFSVKERGKMTQYDHFFQITNSKILYSTSSVSMNCMHLSPKTLLVEFK